MDLVFKDVTENYKFVKTPLEVLTSYHLSCSPLNHLSWSVDANASKLLVIHCLFHVLESVSKSLLWVALLFSHLRSDNQILFPLRSHLNSFLNFNCCILNLILYDILLFRKVVHPWLHHSFILLQLLPNSISLPIKLSQKVLLPHNRLMRTEVSSRPCLLILIHLDWRCGGARDHRLYFINIMGLITPNTATW